MACILHWEEKGLLRMYAGDGVLKGDDIFDSTLMLQSDKRFADIEYVINDFSNVVNYDVSQEDSQLFAMVDAISSRTKPNLKIAIVVPDERAEALAHGYCELMKSSIYFCRVFFEMDGARSWCNSF